MRYRHVCILFALLLISAVSFAGSGKLYITSNVEGKVEINGEEVGKTGELIREVPSGKVKLKVTAEGYKPHEEEITVEEGKINKIKVRLRKEEVKVDFITEPDGATVYIDDEKQKEKTPCTLNVEKGTHNIVIAKNGFKDVVMKKKEITGDDAIEVKMKKGKRKYFSAEEKERIKQEEANAKKGIYHTTFEYDDLPDWLELVTTSGGSGRIENGKYILDVPEENSTAVLRFTDAFPWQTPFRIRIRFSIPSEEKASRFGIVRLDEARKQPGSVEGDDDKRGTMRWVVDFKGKKFGAKKLFRQPGGAAGGSQGGFMQQSAGNTSVPFGEFLNLEIDHGERGVTFRLVNEKEDGKASQGPVPMKQVIKEFGKARFWLSFGDLDSTAVSGRIVIEYIKINITPTRRRR
ncbi:MAG: PEGA domain-containing protein [Planctomycetota bacterium]|jgi:hypothetical protein